MNTKHTPLWWSTCYSPVESTRRATDCQRVAHSSKLADEWRWTIEAGRPKWSETSQVKQRRLWRYTTRDDCVMQHSRELCNHLQERKLKCKNSALSITYCHPQGQWHYSSLLTNGKGQIFIMGRLNTSLGVLVVTTRTIPFFPGCIRWLQTSDSGEVPCYPPSAGRVRMIVGWRCCRHWC